MARHIVAASAAFQPSGRGQTGLRRSPILDYALRLPGKSRPAICCLTTAVGDSPVAIAAFYAAFSGCDDVVPSHLQLFTMPNVDDVAAHLLAQDVIWVWGGSVANLLALWRLHGLDQILRDAWERGIVLGGGSAGSLCWHVGGPTDSFGPQLRPVTDGLAFVPYGNGVHYDSEAERRPLLHRMVADGVLPTSYATDDGVALHYDGTDLAAVVSRVPDARAYRAERDRNGEVRETVLTPTLL
jgi:peptidase E